MRIGLSLGLGAPAPLVATANVIVSMTGILNTAVASMATNATSRRTDYASPQGAITNITCVDFSSYLGTAGLLTPDAFTIKRYLEYPAGVFHQVKWAGATTKALGGANASSTTSDVILSSVTGLPLTIPAGAKFWWRTVNVTASTVTNFPVIQRPATHTALGLDDGNSATDQGNSGTIAADATASTFGPAGVVGTVISRQTARAIILLGDSLAWGQGDVSGVGTNASSGWISRGLAGRFPMVKLAKQGITATAFAGMTTSLTNFFNRLGYTDAIVEAGLNDMSVSSRTPAQILADHQTIYGKFTGHNLQSSARVWQTTMTARTDSTDSYATTANQTPKVDGTYGDVNTLNASIRAVPSGVYKVIDAMAFDATTATSIIHDGPFPPVLDGTHFTSAKAADMAPDILAAMT